MTVGYVTDIHLGAGIEGDTVELLEDIAGSFEDRGVDTVVLLGDIATVESPETARTLSADVRDVFEGFECYATAGNGDHVAVVEDVFEKGPNAVVQADGNTATVLVNSAATSDHHAGRIDEAGLELVEEQLSAGKSVTVAAHHPLQNTDHLPPVFAARPEFAYPDNRARLSSLVESTDGTISTVICGHLHPNGRLRVVGEPLGIELDVIEPVVAIDLVYGEDTVRSLNERIVVEDLVYDP